MAELNEIRFFLFVSLMIFPARAFDVILSGAHQDFKQKSEINIDIIDGQKIYRGTLNQLTYEAELGTTKVIVYIISRSRCIEILRPAVSEIRSQIARELREMHCELVFLGIEHFDDDEYHLIGEFILNKIQFNPDQPNFTIETIGENRFDQFYRCHAMNFEKYQEYPHISEKTLLARLKSIPYGALRPVESDDKEIRLWGCQSKYSFESEVWWGVNVKNNTYVPSVDLRDPKYNFVIKYPNRKICLLMLSGKEYSAVTSHGNLRLKKSTMKKIFDGMTRKKEVLIIFGVFNFDWTEIDIVTQIILKHSEGLQSSGYNVFTYGYGVFNTYYRNVYKDDKRDIRQQPNSYVSEAIKVYVEKEVKQRIINVYYHYDNEWKVSNMSINLHNGRYTPEEGFENFIVPFFYQKVAFIVYDLTEINVPIDYSVVVPSVEELKWSGISVVLIEAINFRLDDMHSIAEWIDHHSGVNDSEQIAVLGGGIFDTIFQSEYTTYNRFLNTKKHELETIRNAYVKSGSVKSVSMVKLDEYSGFKVWSYPMNIIVNGCYEPDLIPDKNTFNTSDGKKIYFVISSSHNFQRISTMNSLAAFTASFRRNINQHYPNWKWSIFLVGLDNFDDRDSHLFAELVKKQTNDDRYLQEFVRKTNFDMSQTAYQYRDSAPFGDDGPYSFIQMRFITFLKMYMQTLA